MNNTVIQPQCLQSEASPQLELSTTSTATMNFPSGIYKVVLNWIEQVAMTTESYLQVEAAQWASQELANDKKKEERLKILRKRKMKWKPQSSGTVLNPCEAGWMSFVTEKGDIWSIFILLIYVYIGACAWFGCGFWMLQVNKTHQTDGQSWGWDCEGAIRSSDVELLALSLHPCCTCDTCQCCMWHHHHYSSYQVATCNTAVHSRRWSPEISATVSHLTIIRIDTTTISLSFGHVFFCSIHAHPYVL